MKYPYTCGSFRVQSDRLPTGVELLQRRSGPVTVIMHANVGNGHKHRLALLAGIFVIVYMPGLLR